MGNADIIEMVTPANMTMTTMTAGMAIATTMMTMIIVGAAATAGTIDPLFQAVGRSRSRIHSFEVARLAG